MNISEKMWLREFSEIFDVLPYYLLVCLPIFIALSPINPVESASELDVHRLAQFELGGNLHGSKQVNFLSNLGGILPHPPPLLFLSIT